jgi:hypothetical protein
MLQHSAESSFADKRIRSLILIGKSKLSTLNEIRKDVDIYQSGRAWQILGIRVFVTYNNIWRVANKTTPTPALQYVYIYSPLVLTFAKHASDISLSLS